MSDFSISTFEAKIATHLKDTLSLAKTARSLEIPKTTVTTALTRLEKKLGVVIFNKKKRTGEITITQDGVDVLPKLEKLALIADSLRVSEGTWGNSKTSGNIILTSTQTLLESFFANYLLAFIEKHPNINVALRQRDDFSLPRQEINEIFLGIWHDENRETHQYIPFHSFSQKLWASKSFIEKCDAIQSIEDIVDKWVVYPKSAYDPSKFFGSKILRTHFPEGASRMKVLEVSGPRIADVMVEKGAGIMTSSEETVRLSKLKVERVLPGFIGDDIEVYAKVDKRFITAPVARYFLDWMFECRDRALSSIGMEASMKYRPYYE